MDHYMELKASPRVIPPTGAYHLPISRNLLFLVIGGLIVAVAALGYKVYDDHRQPKGVQLSIGPSGISVEKK
jgi:hypothetical protein